jgi:hypothetical protein
LAFMSRFTGFVTADQRCAGVLGVRLHTGSNHSIGSRRTGKTRSDRRSFTGHHRPDGRLRVIIPLLIKHFMLRNFRPDWSATDWNSTTIDEADEITVERIKRINAINRQRSVTMSGTVVSRRAVVYHPWQLDHWHLILLSASFGRFEFLHFDILRREKRWKISLNNDREKV